MPLAPREAILLSIADFTMLVPQECAEPKHLTEVYDQINACGDLSDDLKALCLKAAELSTQLYRPHSLSFTREKVFDTLMIVDSIYRALHYDDPARLSGMSLLRQTENEPGIARRPVSQVPSKAVTAMDPPGLKRPRSK